MAKKKTDADDEIVEPKPLYDPDDVDDNAPDRTPLEPGEHLPGQDFRTRVENTAAGDLNQDPREPYPTGNPPDPKEAFHRMHGHYPDEPPPGATKKK